MKHLESKIINLIKEQVKETKRRDKAESNLMIEFRIICKKLDKRVKLNFKCPRVPKRMRTYYNKKFYERKKKKLGNNALIYKITDEDEKEMYIGSTTNTLIERFKLHITAYKKYVDKTCGRFCTLYDLFNKYGIDNCKIILIEQCNGFSRNKLQEREKEYINKNKCINKNLKIKINKKELKEKEVIYKPKSDFENIEDIEEEDKVDLTDYMDLSKIERYQHF